MAQKSPLEEANEIIDMHKPLVSQILKLNREQYLAWTHNAYIYTGTQKDARLFQPDAMEVFTKTAWWVVPVFWAPIITAFAWRYVLDEGLLFASLIMFAGAFTWTLVEYSVHRFLFHVDELLPNVRPLLLVHFLLHGIHHKVPMDRYRLVMPPALSVVLGVLLYKAFHALLYAVPLSAFHAAFAGGLIGYVLYDMMHYSEHHTTFTKGSFLAEMKTYHMKHHFVGQHHLGFGITSKLWDKVFGTELILTAAKGSGARDL